MCTQCAQITPLTGGKKDKTPPKALSYQPPNASTNFNSKSIEIGFDEYLTLKDVSNQFIITPQTKETPDISVSGKKLKVTFSEVLLPNTTYKLNFGNAVTDLNESNVLANFEYIFSTGQTIDSLKLSGQILYATNLKPAEQILVGLYLTNSTDSIIYKNKPLYISKTDATGNFKFNYLPDAPFKLVAIKDQNKNLMYDGSEEHIAFNDKEVNTKDSTKISLLLFKEIPSKQFIKKSLSTEYGKATIIYNKPTNITHVKAKGLISFCQNTLKDTLTLFYNNKFDSLETYIDYVAQKTDTVLIKIISEKAFNRQGSKVNYTFKPNYSSILAFFDIPTFQLNYPVYFKNINTNSISIKEKGDNENKELPYKLICDTGLITSFKLDAALKPETTYTISFLKDAITDHINRTNDSIVNTFTTLSADDYATLNMKLFFPKKENYIVILLNDKEQIVNETMVEFSLNSTSEKIIAYKNILPGNYFIKIVEDINKNGHFDTGDYFLNKQPETIFVNQTAIKLLAGWEIENEWIVK